MISEIPQWLQANRYIDAKDKYGCWSVVYILHAEKQRIKVRLDGWPMKYDEFFSIHSTKIRPFRSVVKGYTGQKKSQGIRQHFHYSAEFLQQKFQELQNFIKDFQYHNADKITQYLRGQHYVIVDYLHGRLYKTPEEMKTVFQYFSLHFQIIFRYMSDLITQNQVEKWFNSEDQAQRAYVQSHFELFDSVYTILGHYLRHSIFKKANEDRISELIAPQTKINEYWGKFLGELGFLKKFEEMLNLLLDRSDGNVPINFVRSIVHLYKALECTTTDKEKKIQLAKKLALFIEKECKKITKLTDESEIEEIYEQVKQIYYKYSWRQSVLKKMQFIRLESWKNLILTENLDKKQKGIIKLKQFYELLNSEKKQFCQIVIDINEFGKWLQHQKLLQLIFSLNEHQEVLKKGFQLIEILYETQTIGFGQLKFIWESCRHKIDTVRKVLYAFLTKFFEKIRLQDVEYLSDLIIEGELAQQIDIKFLYDITHEIVVEDKSYEVNYKVLNFIYERVKDYHAEIPAFAHELTYCDTKSKIWERFLLQIFENIKHRDNVLFHLMILNSIYTQVQAKTLQIQDDFMEIIIIQLKKTLEDKVQENRQDKIKLLLKCIHHLQQEFQIQSQHIQHLWNLFYLPQNEHFQNFFYEWILKESHDPYFNQKVYYLSLSLDYENKDFIFNTILRNPKNIDYINMKQVEFQIFKQLMLQINDKDNKLIIKEALDKGTFKFYRIINSDLLGMKQLWNIFLNCKNQNVIYQVVSFLRDLHLNYHKNFPQKQKIQRTQALLTKLQKNIKDGIKRSNVKLLKHSLLFIKSLIYELKEKTYFHHQRHHHSAKKQLKIKLPSEQIEEVKIQITSTMIQLRRILSEKHKIPLQNLVLRSSHRQFQKQSNYLPIYLAQIPHGELIASKQENMIYEILVKYVQDHLYSYLINVLSDQNSSKEAYSILTQIPQVKAPEEVLQSLIKFEKGNLSQKSIHFQMYMLINVNRLSSAKILQFSETQLFSQVIQLISNKIQNDLDVQLVREALQTTLKVWKSMDNEEIMANNFQKIPICIINIMNHINTMKKATPKELSVLLHCLKSFELVYKKQSINKLVENPFFGHFLHQIYIDCENDYCKENSTKILGDYILKAHKQSSLKIQNQEKLYQIVFLQLYPEIIQKQKNKTNLLYFFQIARYLIYSFSQETLNKLFNQQNKFWRTVVGILEEESDPQSSDKKNGLFQGNLEIAHSSISKRPSLITDEFKNFILYECLFYDENFTKSTTIKCRNKYSVNHVLQILFKICEYSEEDLFKILAQLMKNQRIEYWRNSDFWNVDITQETKSSTGYVGMENPGCICYLNSFMQILYMTPEFRDKIINLNMIEEEGKNYEVLHNMKLLFLNLKYSSRKSIIPTFFTKSIKTFDNKPMIKIFQQMDIDEYSSILFDKIQNLLPKNNNFVQSLFQGVYSNEIISQQCPHISETEENFLSLRLDVKNSIQESLNYLIKGQTLEGENAYMCERCAKKVKALKRQSIKKLPDYLNICLKRFQYNYESDQRIKLNNYCEFPAKLSLEEYSHQFLNKNIESQEVYPKQYFEYELKGVVIHTGIVDSGHYYALIEGRDKKWFQFNDGYVSEFEYQKLADEAFGSKDEFENKVKNAYLMLYQRKSIQNQVEGMQIQNTVVEQQNSQQILVQINKQNKDIQKFQLIFGIPYQEYIKVYVQKLLQTYESSPKAYQFIIQFYLEYCFLAKMRNTNTYHGIEGLKFLQKMLIEGKEGQKNLLYLINMMSTQLFLQQFFDECSVFEKRLIFSRFIETVICKKLEKLEKHFEKVLISSIWKMITFILKLTLKHKALLNELIYIIRKISQSSEIISNFLMMVDALNIISITLFDIEVSELERQQKIKALQTKSEEVLSLYMGEEQSNNMDQHLSIIQTSMESLKKSKSFKTVSKEESWSFINYLLRKMNDKKESYHEEQLERFIRLYEDESITKFVNLIDSATTTQYAHVIANYFKTMCYNNIERTQKLLQILKKSFRDLDSIKFRPFLLIIYHLCFMEDELFIQRMDLIIQLLKEAMDSNSKYFAQSDILQQWVLKMASANQKFRRQIEGTQFIDEILDQIQKNKKPTTELLKKQRHANYGRLSYRYHGLTVASDFPSYEELFKTKRDNFEDLLQKKFVPQDSMEEPKLVQSYKAGQQILLYNNLVWMNGKVEQEMYGLIRISFSSLQGEQHYYYWENDEKIKPYVEPEYQAENEMEIQ